MQRAAPPHSQARVTTGQNLPGTLDDLIRSLSIMWCRWSSSSRGL